MSGGLWPDDCIFGGQPWMSRNVYTYIAAGAGPVVRFKPDHFQQKLEILFF